MVVFCDTSAFYAVGIANDENHAKAAAIWKSLASGNNRIVTSNYTVVETISLAQRRRGIGAVHAFIRLLEDAEVIFVDEPLHRTAIEECLRNSRRHLSFVDHVSFAFMRRHGIRTAFAFDKDFAAHGFKQL
jgi:predicted nucleic acid-binding protein